MKVTRYFAVKVIIVILYFLTVCHSYPSSVGIENHKNEEIKKSFKQNIENIIFNNVNTTLQQNIKVEFNIFQSKFFIKFFVLLQKIWMFDTYVSCMTVVTSEVKGIISF